MQRIGPDQLMGMLKNDLDDALDDWIVTFGPEQVFAAEAVVTGCGLLQHEDGTLWVFFRFARRSPGTGLPDMDTEFGWRFPMSLVRGKLGFAAAAANLACALSSQRMSDPDEVFDLCWIGESSEGA